MSSMKTWPVSIIPMALDLSTTSGMAYAHNISLVHEKMMGSLKSRDDYTCHRETSVFVSKICREDTLISFFFKQVTLLMGISSLI